MKSFVLGFVVLFVAAVFCQAADSSVASSSSEPSQMLDFNLAGYGAKGEKTWEVQGASMDMQGNDVKINDITAHLYGEKENMTLTADHGQFDKETGIIYLRDNVRAVTEGGMKLTTDSLNWSQKDQVVKTQDKVSVSRDNMTATGQGIEAKPDLKIAKFEKDVVLTLEEQRKAEQKKADQGFSFGKGKMVITCDGPMELNYDKNYAVFEKNVKVTSEGDQGAMTSDKMTVVFSQTSRRIDRIEAAGHVVIARGENTSTSDGAVFTAADKRVVLTGRPQLVIFPQEDKNVSP